MLVEGALPLLPLLWKGFFEARLAPIMGTNAWEHDEVSIAWGILVDDLNRGKVPAHCRSAIRPYADGLGALAPWFSQAIPA